MIFLKSLAFNAYLYGLTACMGIAFLPVLLLPSRFSLASIKLWARLVLWGLERIAGTSFAVRGRENIPDGAALVACKHQSMWETVAIFVLIDRPSIVLKKELSYIPVVGWFSMRAGMIVVDRKAHARALKKMSASAGARLRDRRQVVIFPEGTRAPPEGKLDYKPGAAALYTRLGVPCIPVALNSGLYWPRRKFLRRPGTIVIEFLAPIEPGLKRRAFSAELESRIETAAQRLYAEGRAALEESAASVGRTEQRLDSRP